MTPAQEALFTKIEKAIDSHAKLRRINMENPVMAEPSIRTCRLGHTISIYVKPVGSRKKPSEIWGHGETEEEAGEKLIASLDHWAEVI